jgi:hypothetical protein
MNKYKRESVYGHPEYTQTVLVCPNSGSSHSHCMRFESTYFATVLGLNR